MKYLIYLFTFYLLFVLTAFIIRKYIQKSLRHMMFNIIPYLNEKEVDYWVDFGTLIGLHREGDIIMGDNDCDICIWKKDEDKVRPILIEFCLKNPDFTYKEYDWGAFRLHYRYFHMDIYKAYPLDGEDKIGIPSARETPSYLLSFFEKIELPFHNSSLVVKQPSKWKELLEFRYTSNWKKQINKWWLGYFSIENGKLS